MPSHPNPWRTLAPYLGDQRPAEQAPYGLLSPAALVVEADGPDASRWSTGFDYETRDCSTTVTISSPVADYSYTVVEGEEEICYRSYDPFVVEVSYPRSTFNRERNWQDDLDARLLACQQKAIEREFWTGELARATSSENRYLASPDAVDVTPLGDGAVKPAYGVALLEDALAACGCGIRGTLHATSGVGSTLGFSPDDDGGLVTSLGTRAVIGAGYTGVGPGNAAVSGDQRWLYATGPVTTRLGPVEHRTGETGPVVDTRNNRFTVYAERAAAVTWDSCCHFAVLVDLSLDYS